MPAVGAGSARSNCLMCKGLMCSYSFKLHVSYFWQYFKHKRVNTLVRPYGIKRYTFNTTH